MRSLRQSIYLLIVVDAHSAQIALGNHFLVIQKVRDDAPHVLRAAKLLAQHMQARTRSMLPRVDSLDSSRLQDPVSSEDAVNAGLDKMLCDSQAATNPSVLLLVGQIFNSQGKYEETLKHIHDSENVEL